MKTKLQEANVTLKLLAIAKQRLVKRGITNPTKDMINLEVKRIIMNAARKEEKGYIRQHGADVAIGTGVGTVTALAINKKLKDKKSAVNEGKVGTMIHGAKVAMNSKGLNAIRAIAMKRLAKRGIVKPTFSQLKNEIKVVRLAATKAKYAVVGVGVVGSGAVVAATKKEGEDISYKNYLMEVIQNNVNNFTCEGYEKLYEKINVMSEDEAKIFMEGVKENIKRNINDIKTYYSNPVEMYKSAGRQMKSIFTGKFKEQRKYYQILAKKHNNDINQLKLLLKTNKISKDTYNKKKKELDLSFIKNTYK